MTRLQAQLLVMLTLLGDNTRFSAQRGFKLNYDDREKEIYDSWNNIPH